MIDMNYLSILKSFLIKNGIFEKIKLNEEKKFELIFNMDIREQKMKKSDRNQKTNYIFKNLPIFCQIISQKI